MPLFIRPSDQNVHLTSIHLPYLSKIQFKKSFYFIKLSVIPPPQHTHNIDTLKCPSCLCTGFRNTHLIDHELKLWNCQLTQVFPPLRDFLCSLITTMGKLTQILEEREYVVRITNISNCEYQMNQIVMFVPLTFWSYKTTAFNDMTLLSSQHLLLINSILLSLL